MNRADFVRVVDSLEDRASSYVTLDEVESAIGHRPSAEIEDALLLVDYRARADGTPIALCRLNRQHPEVRELTTW